jgi:hypothetical protein
MEQWPDGLTQIRSAILISGTSLSHNQRPVLCCFAAYRQIDCPALTAINRGTADG